MIDLYDGFAGTVSAPDDGPTVTGTPDVKPVKTGGNVHVYHGSLGDPGYHLLHPGNRGKGQERHARGGMLGSPDHTSAEHLKTLKAYTRKRYIDMNNFLRHGTAPSTGSTKDVERDNRVLNDLIDIQDPLESDGEYWRGTKTSLGDFKVGDEFHDKGFISMASDSIGPRHYFSDPQGALFKVTVPQGTRGVKVASLGIPDPEGELILPPGTRFRVTGVTPSQGGKPAQYDLEVIRAE